VAERLVYDHRTADLPPEDLALCEFAVKLTRAPGAVVPGDLDVLRGHGFYDEAITIAVQVISYFNYINRVADGLGVDPETWMEPSREDWDARRARDIPVEGATDG